MRLPWAYISVWSLEAFPKSLVQGSSGDHYKDVTFNSFKIMNRGQASCCLQHLFLLFNWLSQKGWEERVFAMLILIPLVRILSEKIQLEVCSWESHCWIVQREQIWPEIRDFMLCGGQITYQILQYITTASVVPRELFHIEELQPAVAETSRYTARLIWLAPSLWKGLQTEIIFNELIVCFLGALSM